MEDTDRLSKWQWVEMNGWMLLATNLALNPHVWATYFIIAYSKMHHDMEDHDVSAAICHWTDTNTKTRKAHKQLTSKNKNTHKNKYVVLYPVKKPRFYDWWWWFGWILPQATIYTRGRIGNNISRWFVWICLKMIMDFNMIKDMTNDVCGFVLLHDYLSFVGICFFSFF